MNLFNRIVVILLLLFGIVSSVALIFLVVMLPGPAIASMRDFFGVLGESLTPGLQTLVAAVAALFAIVGFLLLLLELLPRSAKGVKLTGVTGASAELTLEAIVDRIRYEVMRVPSVSFVKPVVRSKGREIDVNLSIRTDPTIDVAAKTEEVSQLVRDVVENKMGIKLRHLRVYVYHDQYPKTAPAKVAPRPPAGSEPTTSDLT